MGLTVTEVGILPTVLQESGRQLLNLWEVSRGGPMGTESFIISQPFQPSLNYSLGRSLEKPAHIWYLHTQHLIYNQYV